MAGPRYPTRAELESGAQTVEAVPKSIVLRAMTSDLGHALDKASVYWIGFSFISWQAARLRGIAYQPSLLLETTGRKSGQVRTCVLPYVRVGSDFVVAGSNAGRPHDPHWVANLRACPVCRIRVSRRTQSAHARIADGAERDALLEAVAQTRPHVHNYDAHARRHGRRLELAVLTPVQAAAVQS